MKRIFLWLSLTGAGLAAQAQELYVNTEPASNMPAKSLGVRLTGKLYPSATSYMSGGRVSPEVMVGISKKLMVHASGYFANTMQKGMNFEGGSLYAKYRFLSNDEVHSHFRMAAYLRGSLINARYEPGLEDHHERGPFRNQELDLDGMTSGVGGGVIATQLIHKLAISAGLGYDRYMDNPGYKMPLFYSRNAVDYTLSAGYLLLPRKYKNYKQTNLNLYAELLGKSNLDQYRAGYYVDVAPAVQLIFNSVTRVDFSYRRQLFGDMDRAMTSSYLLRLEHNFFNVFGKKH
ncbi:hypothetical protein ACWKWU_05305 [Chitinophaga lutea]